MRLSCNYKSEHAMPLRSGNFAEHYNLTMRPPVIAAVLVAIGIVAGEPACPNGNRDCTIASLQCTSTQHQCVAAYCDTDTHLCVHAWYVPRNSQCSNSPML